MQMLQEHHQKETLHSFLQKQVVENHKIQSSLAFYNHLFLVQNPNQSSILDVGAFNQFLQIMTFKG